jgi:TonB family protein
MNYRRGSLGVLAAYLLLASATSFGDWVPEDIQGASYPPLARDARITGVVAVEFRINADGTVADARALSGPPMLRPASVQAAKRWHFRANDKTKSPFQVIFDFRLEGECSNILRCKETVIVHYPDRIIITSEFPILPAQP